MIPQIRIALFNHKGGVGKTTLTVNLASALTAAGRRVLLVDSDPQCNLTSYLVEDTVVDEWLEASDSDAGTTIWSALKPFVEGTGAPKAITPVERPGNLFLIPGDIRLAEFEAELSTYWAECVQRRVRGFRGVSSLRGVVTDAASRCQADIVLYDTGPNVGALNRAILLDCDYFAVPVACDLFSLRAIKTLGHALTQWIADWDTIAKLAPDGVDLLVGRPRLLGYVTQRFRVYGGQVSSSYATVLPKLERSMNEDLITPLTRVDPWLVSAAISPLRIGELKDYTTIANAAQYVGAPMWEADKGTRSQKADAKADFDLLAANVLKRITEAPRV